MKNLSSAGVALAIVAAGAVGVVTTWMLMRQPQPVVVVFEEAQGETGNASRMDPPTAISTTKENQPSRLHALTPSNSFPKVPTPSVASANRELPPETRPTAGTEQAAQPASVIYQGVNAPIIQQTNQLVLNERVPPGTPQSSAVTSAAIDDALSFALEAAERYVKEGFTVREDFWGGDLAVKSTKAIVHQLFRGNEYWFCVGTGVKEAKISVHIYDSDGHPAEREAWAKPHFAAARVPAGKTGSYYVIVEVEDSNLERTPWALVYGFR